jgi:kynureninase
MPRNSPSLFWWLISLPFGRDDLVVASRDPERGQFLTFELENARDLQTRMQAANIITDVRNNRLRISFGLYHDADSPGEAALRIAQALA